MHTLLATGGTPFAGMTLTGNVNLVPTKDNTIYEESPTIRSNGAGTTMIAGNNNAGMAFSNRALVAFDIASTIPAGATITGVTVTLDAFHPQNFPTGNADNGPQVISLHKLLEDWGEGASNAGGVPGAGQGQPAQAPDATWNDAMYPTTPWTTPGGVYNLTASGMQTVNYNGLYSWTSATMVADVQDWLDNPANNAGWILIGNEVGVKTTKHFNTRESAMPPALAVTYTTSGGGTYTYLWSDGQTTAAATGLTAGTHIVTVTDANGCEATAIAIIAPAGTLALSTVETDALCNGR